MRWSAITLLALALCSGTQATSDYPSSGGKCTDPNPIVPGEDFYACGVNQPGSVEKPGSGEESCSSHGECLKNCCVPNCGEWECVAAENLVKLAGVDLRKNPSNENCCAKEVTVTVTAQFTTTITPYDSSSSGSGGASSESLNSASLNEGALASDASESAHSSGSNQSGSSASYLPIWQWLVIISTACCCTAGLLAALYTRKPKKPRKKPAPIPAPLPVVLEAVPMLTPIAADGSQQFLMPPPVPGVPWPGAGITTMTTPVTTPVTTVTTPTYTLADLQASPYGQGALL